MKRTGKCFVGAAAVLLVGMAMSSSCMRRPPSTEHVIGATTHQGGPRLARVLLAHDRPSATLASSAPCTVHVAATEEVLLEVSSLPRTAVRATARGIAFGQREFPHAALRVVAHRDGALAVNGSRYRGHLLVRRTRSGQLAIINHIPVDHYLYSVLGSETYRSWPRAALEAQAIVARSYAMWRMAQRRGGDFDLRATVLDQNYLGVAKEAAEFRAAVDRTAGVVLLYQMKLFRCYYHSTCGGHTEAVERVFPDAPLLPLSGARCAWCTGSKHYRWRRELSKSALASALRTGGVAIQGLAALEVTARTPAGRAEEVVVRTSDGRSLTFRGGDFRLKIGPQKLPSVWFQLRETPGGYEFQGRGWGHGVGMCQWGSKGMADAGHSAADILRHYYPGATLQRIYGTRTSNPGHFERSETERRISQGNELRFWTHG
jgi:stage II sporulation protein D